MLVRKMRRNPSQHPQTAHALHPKNDNQSSGMQHPIAQLKTLQQTVGNKAVQKIMGTSTPSQLMLAPIQRAPVDMEEEELQLKVENTQEEEEELQLKDREEEDEKVQMKSAPIQTKKDAKMPEHVQNKMETAFGTDFSNVKINVGQEAPSIGALAFTKGENIYFAPGQYNPDTPDGQKLLGHELTHVVQQRKGKVEANTQINGLPVNNELHLEREADQMGEKAARL